MTAFTLLILWLIISCVRTENFFLISYDILKPHVSKHELYEWKLLKWEWRFESRLKTGSVETMDKAWCYVIYARKTAHLEHACGEPTKVGSVLSNHELKYRNLSLETRERWEQIVPGLQEELISQKKSREIQKRKQVFVHKFQWGCSKLM